MKKIAKKRKFFKVNKILILNRNHLQKMSILKVEINSKIITGLEVSYREMFKREKKWI